MLGPELLLDTLDKLDADDFKRFRWYLSQPVLDGRDPIPRSQIESLDRCEIVDKMTQSFGKDLAVDITVQVLQKMNHNDAAEDLKKSYEGANGVQPKPIFSAVPSAEGHTVHLSASGYQEAVVIAPMISDRTGALVLTEEKKWTKKVQALLNNLFNGQE